jgi:serine/threonine-protein kinase
MSPEQVLGKPLTPQADVYAFGILLYELFTGSKPLGGESVEKIFQQILNEPLNLEPMKKLKVPPVVCDVVARCTAKLPSQRPQTLGPVSEELERLIDTLPVSKTPVGPDPNNVRTVTSMRAAHGPVPVKGLPGFLEHLPAPLRSQGGLMLLAGGIVLAALLLIYVVLTLAHLI